jgi:hypothetical protein
MKISKMFELSQKAKDKIHQKRLAKTMVCSHCGCQGIPRTITKGSFVIELVLWCCFFIPGLIYSCWRLTSRYEACPFCLSPNMLPRKSPRAQSILRQVQESRQETSGPESTEKS